MDMSTRDYSNFKVYDPIACLNRNNEHNFAVISHNHDELIHQSIYDLWNNASYRACTSSGYGFCEQAMKHHKSVKEKEIDVLAGDLDEVPYPNIIVTSPMSKVSPKFKDRIIYSHDLLKGPEAKFDQLKICIENTVVDLKHKAISAITAIVILSDKKNNLHDYVMYGDFLSSSRLTSLCDGLPVYFLCCESCIFHIPPGKSAILTKNYATAWCSLVPLEDRAIVTTRGLKWNLQNDEMAFEKLVSTSNELDKEQDVLINTDKPLIWSMAFKY